MTIINNQVFKEPRGAIRILQCVLSICAFATTAGYYNTLTVVFCGDERVIKQFQYDYPFKLDVVKENIACNASLNGNFSLVGDHSTPAEFFVATGVIAFLFTSLMIVFYGVYDNIYITSGLLPKCDFLITLVISIFWLCASIAWSNGLADIKSITEANVIKNMELCKQLECVQVVSGGFSTLNISVIIGFLNFVIWIASLWFLYKETLWFRSNISINI